MLAEFEEKQYEQLINIELTRGHNLLPIGQSQENFCGFDGALWTAHPRFWQYITFYLPRWARIELPLSQLGWPRLWPGNLPKGITIEELGELCEGRLNLIVRKLPQIRFNVLIQYKRSEYMRSPKSREWVYWEQPYYRYKLVRWQLETLVRIAQRVGKRAIVVYAAPSFYTIRDLIIYAEQQQLVANSNFRRALDLKGHWVYTFIAPGSAGKAFSELETFSDDFHFLEEIGRLARREEREFRPNREYLRWLAKALEQSVIEDANVRELYSRYHEGIQRLSHWPLTQSLVRLNFISWLVQIRIFLGFAK